MGICTCFRIPNTAHTAQLPDLFSVDGALGVVSNGWVVDSPYSEPSQQVDEAEVTGERAHSTSRLVSQARPSRGREGLVTLL